MDVIFNSGNGVARVDDLWFDHAPQTNVLGVIVRLSPAEEMIWSKAFIQERERFDGADVLHLLREIGPSLDWPRLLMRFGDYWRVLLSHIILFGFVYPDKRQNVPAWVMDELIAAAEREPARTCRATSATARCCRASSTSTTSIDWKYRDAASSRGPDDAASRSRSGPRRSESQEVRSLTNEYLTDRDSATAVARESRRPCR